jgi:hypothetical protein
MQIDAIKHKVEKDYDEIIKNKERNILHQQSEGKVHSVYK